MTDTKKASWQWRRMLLLLAGSVGLSMALAALVSYLLPQGVVRLAISTTVLAAGLIATGWQFWRHSRDVAGDQRRPELVSILAFAFLVMHEREWVELLTVEGWQNYLARFLLTCIAFGMAMLVYRWLQPIDAREAQDNAKSRAGAAS